MVFSKAEQCCSAFVFYDMPHQKNHLPEKICVSCNRSFTWRKKWQKVWDEVKYCSDKCRYKKVKKSNCEVSSM